MLAFYALETRWFSPDRLYKIYVGPATLHGALLARQVYDDASARAQLVNPAGILGPLMLLWANRLIRKREEREAAYDHMDVTGKDLLRKDPRNFRIEKRDIVNLRFERKARTLWTGLPVAISGMLQIETRDRVRRKFILVGEQDADAILSAIGAGRLAR